MTPPPIEILEHTADIGFHAWGATPGELFANAAQAMMAIATDAEPAPDAEIDVEVSGPDYESLMVNWLSEILYLFDAGIFAPAVFRVLEISGQKLRARLSGERRDPPRHPWKLIVKAVTYHQLAVAERDGRWQATVFLDI